MIEQEQPQKIKFRPALESGRGKEIDAYIIPELPMLCVHQCPFENHFTITGRWKVSHIESGRRLIGGETKDSAIQVAIDMLKECDIEKWITGELKRWEKIAD